MPTTEEAVQPPASTVIVADRNWRPSLPGYFALTSARMWESQADPVLVWRGPEKPDEWLLRSHLTEMKCQTVLLDEHGFFTCTPHKDEVFLEEVREQAEKFLNEYANERAAEAHSYIDNERAREKYGEEVFVVARFGDATAVDGEQVFSARHAKPPRNYEITDMGGRVPEGSEEEADIDLIVEVITPRLSEILKYDVPEDVVEETLELLYGERDYVSWTSDSGHVEVFASRRAIRAQETEEERRARLEEARREREARARRRLEEEQRRQRIRKGGFPSPRDWSPRGELP